MVRQPASKMNIKCFKCDVFVRTNGIIIQCPNCKKTWRIRLTIKK